MRSFMQMGSDFDILVDLDDVIADCSGHVLTYLQKLFGVARACTIEDCIDWNYEDCLPGVTREHIDKIFHTPEFFLTMPVINGSWSFLKSLSTLGKIHIVTARYFYPEIAEHTVEWLNTHDMYYDHVVCIKAKEKVKYARENNVKLAFEDKIETAIDLSELCPVGLMAVPRNDVDVSYHSILRIDGLQKAAAFADFVYNLNDKKTCIKDKPADSSSDHSSILLEAEKLVHGDRNQQYGHPLDDMTNSADIATVVLRKKLLPGERVVAEDMPLIMEGVKISRELNRYKRDNHVDGAGYWETLNMIHDERKRRLLK